MVKMSKFYYKTKLSHWLAFFKKGEKENLLTIDLSKKMTLGEDVIYKMCKV